MRPTCHSLSTLLVCSLVLHCLSSHGGALPPDKKPPAKPDATKTALSVEDLTEQAMKSIAVVQFSGRDGRRVGLGTGFVIDPNGLIATNLHVIGEARPITVTMADGKKYDVEAIHATEKAMDLAILKIDAKGLPSLPLGNSDRLRPGQQILALGNPLGLKLSVVRGVVSGQREIEGKPMIQLAVPIEEGNSGGPAIDRQGRVIGILTMKHRFTDNLGFAVAINALKPLIAKPNPIPINRWLTIGALDDRDWKTHHGGRWRQRAGRIHVEGSGSGFGGRALCFSQHDAPTLPYEVQVHVKLHDNDGAAGLVVCGDGSDRHYGFYPTSGQMRLTRFDGPTVTSWSILKTLPSTDYRPGEWNTLKVRVSKDKLSCYLNDKLVIETQDTAYRTARVGLAKFRHTEAEFRGFRVAATIPPFGPTQKLITLINKLVTDISPQGDFSDTLLTKLTPTGGPGTQVLRNRARLLEQQASQLRELARVVHHRRVVAELQKTRKQPDARIDLLHAALLIAWLDNDELDVEAYRRQFDRMAADLANKLAKQATTAEKLSALRKHFFNELGFHGSRIDYYNRSNSYLNEVLDDREGLPISLSLLYIELGRRIGLKIEGIGLPGHFVVRPASTKTPALLVDVFDGGRTMPREKAERLIVEAHQPRPTGDARKRIIAEFLAPETRRAILVRMASNLSNIAQRRSDEKAISRYADVILAVDPNNLRHRGIRIQIAMRRGHFDKALADIDWLLEHPDDQIDARQLQLLRKDVAQKKAAPR
ncbi:MAG: transglutaminase family protein [Planctomycetaceae bacterium]|nr:transglutaminase family protein [Planctomycetaceae bacterium]